MKGVDFEPPFCCNIYHLKKLTRTKSYLEVICVSKDQLEEHQWFDPFYIKYKKWDYGYHYFTFTHDVYHNGGVFDMLIPSDDKGLDKLKKYAIPGVLKTR